MENHKGCKGCEERHVGCHSTCEIYKAYREELDKAKEARIQAYKECDVMDGYIVGRIEKIRKANRRMKSQKRKARK